MKIWYMWRKIKRDWYVDLLLPKDECPFLHYPMNYHGCELLDEGQGRCEMEQCPHIKRGTTSGELRQLLSESLPEVKAYRAQLTKLWPGAEVATHLHRLDSLVARLEKEVGPDGIRGMSL